MILKSFKGIWLGRLVIFIVFYSSFYLYLNNQYPSQGNFDEIQRKTIQFGKSKTINIPKVLQPVFSWDVKNYTFIAKYGYQDSKNYAFLPGYPLLVRVFSFNAINDTMIAWSAFIISNLGFLTFVWGLFLLIKDLGFSWPRFSLVYFIFPTTFFFNVPYSEPIFMAFAIFSFYFYRKGNFLFAAIFASLALATRIIGAAILMAYFLDQVRLWAFKKEKPFSEMFKTLLILSIGGLTLLAYMYFCYSKTGNFFQFLEVQDEGWERKIGLPLVGAFVFLYDKLVTEPSIFRFFELFVIIAFIGLLVANFNKLPFELWSFSLLAILIPLSTSSTMSLSRLCLVSFGTFIIASLYLPKYKLLYYGYIVVAGLMMLFFSSKYAIGLWVA